MSRRRFHREERNAATYEDLVKYAFEMCKSTQRSLRNVAKEDSLAFMIYTAAQALEQFGLQPFQGIFSSRGLGGGNSPGRVGLDNIHFLNMRTPGFMAPLNAFFLNYTVDSHEDDVIMSCLGEADKKRVCSLETVYGTFYFVFVSMSRCDSTESTIKLHLQANYEYLPPQGPPLKFPALLATTSYMQDGDYIAMARIEPYVCKVCGVYRDRMKKCGGCWKFLGICVRYCSEECQLQDYPLHRRVCGGMGRSVVAIAAINKRKKAIFDLDLQDDLIHPDNGFLGFKREPL